jgi:hypothetical protein
MCKLILESWLIQFNVRVSSTEFGTPHIYATLVFKRKKRIHTDLIFRCSRYFYYKTFSYIRKGLLIKLLSSYVKAKTFENLIKNFRKVKFNNILKPILINRESFTPCNNRKILCFTRKLAVRSS